MPHSAELVSFVDAVIAGDEGDVVVSRRRILDAVGAAAFVDVCATVASFNAVVKIADGTGIALEEAKALRTNDLRKEFGIDAMRAH